MIIDAIDHYLNNHSPSADEVEVLRRIRLRRQAHDDFKAGFDARMNQGFVRIERVSRADPVMLFGQNVPSYAFNRITVSRGMDDEHGQRIPGESLLTALISEESLAQLMLSSNRSNRNIAMTLESVLGDTLPERRGLGRRTSSDLLSEQIDEFHDRRADLLQGLQAEVNGLERGLSKKAAEEYLSILQRIRPRDETSFLLRRHAENLQNDLVKYRVEAANAALNITDIMKEVEKVKRIGVNTHEPDITDLELARNANPILDCAMKLYRPDEARICQKAVKAYFNLKLMEAFPEGIDYDVDVDDPHGQRLRKAVPWNSRNEVDTEPLESIAVLASSLGNEHTNKSRARADGYGMTASTSYISGGDTDLHSSFPATDNGHFSLRFHVGILEEGFGNERIQEAGTFLELGMSPEDMMTALRGHPTGAPIPCSLDRVTMQSVPRVTYESEITRAIQGGDESDDCLHARNRLEGILQAAEEIIRAGAKSAGSRRHLQQLISEAGDHLEVAIEAEAESISYRANRLNAEVQSMARSAMALIEDYVMEKHDFSLLALTAAPDNETIETYDP